MPLPRYFYDLSEPITLPGFEGQYRFTDYFNDPAAVATLPSAVTAALVPNQRVFVSEVRHDGERFNFLPIVSSGSMYSRALF